MTTVYALLHWGGWHDESETLRGVYSSEALALAARSPCTPVPEDDDDPLTWHGHMPGFVPSQCWDVRAVALDAPEAEQESAASPPAPPTHRMGEVG